MELKQAIEILKAHNEWRRGADIPMTDPTSLGEAIDCVVENYEDRYETIAQAYETGFAQGQEVGEREMVDKACELLCETCIDAECSKRCKRYCYIRKAMEE